MLQGQSMSQATLGGATRGICCARPVRASAARAPLRLGRCPAAGAGSSTTSTIAPRNSSRLNSNCNDSDSSTSSSSTITTTSSSCCSSHTTTTSSRSSHTSSSSSGRSLVAPAPSASLAVAAAAALGLAAVAAAAGEAHAEPLGQLSSAALDAVKIPGLVGDSQFTEGFVSGLLLIFFSEIGDKTFFIALLLALRQDRTAVFTGTFGALAIMTVISVALGQVFHQLDGLLPAAGAVPLDDVLAVGLLTYFGINTLRGAADADARAAEEKEEAGEAVTELTGGGGAAAVGLVASTFGLVFAAEWGDKSFLATIALAAASDPAGVTAGAVTGHGLATGLAVAGGSLLSRYVSERNAQYIGGSLFLVFAAATVFDIVTGAHGS